MLLSVDRANIEQARADALRVINLLSARATADQPIDMDRCITIIDELGAHLLTVSFRDALHWSCLRGEPPTAGRPAL